MAWFAWRRRNKIIRVDPEQSEGFRFFRGRRHVEGAPYLLPKDEGEINRLDFQHYLFRHVLRGNFLAPLSAPRSILDVGCGTGRWAIEMARQFPQANIIGIDMAPPPSETASPADPRPDNYAFVQGNILEGLPFEEQTFDYVHQRLLYAAIPAQEWPRVINELARVTMRRGWVELLEGSAVVQGGGPALANFTAWGAAASAARGIDIHIGSQIGRLLYAAGLQNVVLREIRLPVGAHGGRVGLMVEANLLAVFAALRMPIITHGIVSEQDFDANMMAMKEEITHGRCEWSAYVAYGQRLA
jgi:SAM-dependent methyltransferase